MNDVERLEVKFKEALTSRDKGKLQETYATALGLITRNDKPPIIAPSKKAYEQLIYAYVCHVASHDALLPYVLWWRAYYGNQTTPKKPQHSVTRSRSHLREMRKHSQMTARLCKKHRVVTK